MPVLVDDGSVPYTIFTTAPTVGEALLRERLSLYLGDHVQPSLGSPVSAGLRVKIERSSAVFVTADGRTTHTRTRGKTVGGTLMDLGILVNGNDRVIPPLNQPVVAQQQIRVVRVLHVTLVEGKPIPYESILVPDDTLEVDQQRLQQPGVNGEHRRRFKVVFEDGAEISRTPVDEWVAALAGDPHRRLRAADRPAAVGYAGRPGDLLAQDPHVRHRLLPWPRRHADHGALVWPHADRPATAEGHRGRGSESDPAP